MSSQGTFGVTAYCLCGASMVGKGAGNLDAAETLTAIFYSVHKGEGHGPTNARTAANARRRQSRLPIDGETP